MNVREHGQPYNRGPVMYMAVNEHGKPYSKKCSLM